MVQHTTSNFIRFEFLSVSASISDSPHTIETSVDAGKLHRTNNHQPKPRPTSDPAAQPPARHRPDEPSPDATVTIEDLQPPIHRVSATPTTPSIVKHRQCSTASPRSQHQRAVCGATLHW
ncbi:hypothetical protein RYX36_032129 [Vicia faba]